MLRSTQSHAHARRHQLAELDEVHRTISVTIHLVDHPLNFLERRFLSERLENNQELLGSHRAVAVLCAAEQNAEASLGEVRRGCTLDGRFFGLLSLLTLSKRLKASWNSTICCSVSLRPSEPGMIFGIVDETRCLAGRTRAAGTGTGLKNGTTGGKAAKNLCGSEIL